MDPTVCMWGSFWNLLLCPVSGAQGCRQSIPHQSARPGDTSAFATPCLHRRGGCPGSVFTAAAASGQELCPPAAGALPGDSSIPLPFLPKPQPARFGSGWPTIWGSCGEHPSTWGPLFVIHLESDPGRFGSRPWQTGRAALGQLHGCRTRAGGPGGGAAGAGQSGPVLPGCRQPRKLRYSQQRKDLVYNKHCGCRSSVFWAQLHQHGCVLLYKHCDQVTEQ